MPYNRNTRPQVSCFAIYFWPFLGNLKSLHAGNFVIQKFVLLSCGLAKSNQPKFNVGRLNIKIKANQSIIMPEHVVFAMDVKMVIIFLDIKHGLIWILFYRMKCSILYVAIACVTWLGVESHLLLHEVLRVSCQEDYKAKNRTKANKNRDKQRVKKGFRSTHFCFLYSLSRGRIQGITLGFGRIDGGGGRGLILFMYAQTILKMGSLRTQNPKLSTVIIVN